MLRTVLTMAVLFGGCLCVCADESTEQAAAVNFTDHVLPIFRQHCLKCHNANDAEAGLAIDSYGGLMEGGGSGDAVVAGDASASRLYLVMTHAEEPTMPPNQEPLPEETLEVIRKWIEGGLLENSGSKAKKRKGPSLSFSTAVDGEPDEIVMPESLWRKPVITSERAAAVTALASSPWAPLVAVAGQRQVSLYNSESSELIGIIPYPEGVPQVLQFSRDGAYLLVAGGTHSALGTASLYDVRTGERMFKVGDEFDIVFGADINDQLNRVALGGPQKIVRIFDATTGEVEFELKKHTDWVYCVDYSPDGVLVASGDRAGGLHVWEADTGRLYLDLVGHQAAVRALTWRSDSNVLLSASEDGTVKMWDMNSGNQLKSFNAHGGGVTGIAMAKDGRLATSGNDKTIKLWNADGSALATMPAFSEPALKVALTHDGSKVVGGDWDGRTIMWLISDPKQASELLSNPPSLEEQKLAAATRVAELEKALEDANSELVKRQTAVDSSKTSEAGLLARLEETHGMLANATEQKAAAEKLLAEFQKQKTDQDARVKAIRERLAELEQKTKQTSQQLEQTRGEHSEASAKSERTRGEMTSVDQSLASIQSEQEQRKSALTTGLLAMTERELDLLAAQRARASDLSRSQAESQKAEELAANLNAQLDALSKTIQSITQQMQAAVADTKAAEEAIASLTTQVESVSKTFDAKVAELEALQKQLSESQDEGEQKLIAEKVKSQEKEVESEKQMLAEAKAKLSAAIDRKEKQAKLAQESERQLSAAKKSHADLLPKRDQAVQEVAKLKAQQEQYGQSAAEYANALARLRTEMEAATQSRLEAVDGLADLFAKQSALEQQRQGLQDELSRQEQVRDAAGTKIAALEKTRIELEKGLTSVRAELDESEKGVTELAERLKAQPAMIQELARQIKQHTDALPGVEKQLADLRKQLEQSSSELAVAKTSVEEATKLLDDARARHEGIQAELVAFNSFAEKLQGELTEAQAVAREKRSAVEPEAKLAEKLAESIASRDGKLKELAALLKQLQEEIQGLREAQEGDQASLEATKVKLQDLESSAEESEAAADSVREKVEFFQSSYGA